MNGISYTVKDLARLPPDLAAYKAAQHSDDKSLVFHREPSPFSNFHTATFTIDNQQFLISEHYIQYSKAIYFRDTHTANTILNCLTPHEVKRLIHQINGMNPDAWKENA